MRFLADMGVSLRVVEWLRSAGHNARHLREEGLQRPPAHRASHEPRGVDGVDAPGVAEALHLEDVGGLGVDGEGVG